MKNMIIFDPAMCCSTGVCGPSVNPELLRVATTINTLKNKGIIIQRYNLSQNPQAFIDNKIINQILNTKGVQALPVTMLDGVVVKYGSYPTKEEFCRFLGISADYLSTNSTIKKANKCNCKGGDCC